MKMKYLNILIINHNIIIIDIDTLNLLFILKKIKKLIFHLL